MPFSAGYDQFAHGRFMMQDTGLAPSVCTEISDPLVEISPDSSVDEALTVVRSRKMRILPVTSEGRLVGILTSDDISRATSIIPSNIVFFRTCEARSSLLSLRGEWCLT